MPNIHPREKAVMQAEQELRKALVKIFHDLTEAEYIKVLGTVLAGELQTLAKWMIRAERHPNDPDKPGGLE